MQIVLILVYTHVQAWKQTEQDKNKGAGSSEYGCLAFVKTIRMSWFNSSIFCDLTQIHLPDLDAQKALQRQGTTKDSDASQLSQQNLEDGERKERRNHLSTNTLERAFFQELQLPNTFVAFCYFKLCSWLFGLDSKQFPQPLSVSQYTSNWWHHIPFQWNKSITDYFYDDSAADSSVFSYMFTFKEEGSPLHTQVAYLVGVYLLQSSKAINPNVPPLEFPVFWSCLRETQNWDIPPTPGSDIPLGRDVQVFSISPFLSSL